MQCSAVTNKELFNSVALNLELLMPNPHCHTNLSGVGKFYFLTWMQLHLRAELDFSRISGWPAGYLLPDLAERNGASCRLRHCENAAGRLQPKAVGFAR